MSDAPIRMWIRVSASLRDAASATISSIRATACFSRSFAAFFPSSVGCGSGGGWVARRWRGICANGDERSDDTMMTVRMDEKTLRDFKVITTCFETENRGLRVEDKIDDAIIDPRSSIFDPRSSIIIDPSFSILGA